MQIITNNIEKECWDLLSLYEDIEYVKEQIKLVKPKIKQTSLKKVASEINLYIKQANELYNSNNDNSGILFKTSFKDISIFSGKLLFNNLFKSQKVPELFIWTEISFNL